MVNVLTKQCSFWRLSSSKVWSHAVQFIGNWETSDRGRGFLATISFHRHQKYMVWHPRRLPWDPWSFFSSPPISWKSWTHPLQSADTHCQSRPGLVVYMPWRYDVITSPFLPIPTLAVGVPWFLLRRNLDFSSAAGEGERELINIKNFTFRYLWVNKQTGCVALILIWI